MFSGDHKRKKVVSLRGASKQVDREDILKKAQEDRAKRQEERDRLNAAKTFQSTYRGKKSRERTRALLRQQHDELLSSVKQQQQHTASPLASPPLPSSPTSSFAPVLSTAMLGKLASMLILFYQPDTDRRRLENYLSLLLKHLEAEDHHVALLEADGTRVSPVWMWRLARLARITMSHPFISDIAFEYYDKVTSAAAFPGRYTAPRILPQLVRAGLLGTALRQVESNTGSDALIGRWTGVFVRVVAQAGPDDGPMLVMLAHDVLSQSPETLVIHRCMTALRTTLPFAALVTRLPAVLPAALATWPLGNRAWLLANMVTLCEGQLGKCAAREALGYMETVALLIRHLPRTIFVPVKFVPEQEEDSEDEDPSDAGALERLPDDLLSVPGIVAKLFQPQHIRACLHALNPDDAGSVHACMGVLCMLCTCSPDSMHRRTLLSTLAFNMAFLQAQVRFMRALHGSYGDVARRRGKDMYTAAFTALFDPVFLFCETLSFHLLTVDDSEFAAHVERLFGKDGLVSLLGWLIDIAVALFLDAPPSRIAEFRACRRALTRFLQHVFTRWTRVRFCPENVWLAPGVSQMLQANAVWKTIDAEVFGRIAEEEGKVRLDEDPVDEDLAGHPGGVENTTTKIVRVLLNMPFVVPFMDRAQVFRALVASDRRVSQFDEFHMMGSRFVRIRRDHMYQDAFDAFSTNEAGGALRGRVRVQMVSRHGMDEAGIDGGGLFREFLQDLINTAFDPATGFFKSGANNALYPNPQVQLLHEDCATHYRFMGRMLGKAIYEGMLMEIPFASFFLTKLLGNRAFFHDLASLDAELHQHLLSLKSFDGDVADLDLDFTVAEDGVGDARAGRVRELIPGGSRIPVTNENRITYIYQMADFRLNTQIKHQTAAFRSGLNDLIDPIWLRLFAPLEFQMLISGARSVIDVRDMFEHVVYSGGFDAQHATIQMFWTVVEAFTDEQRSALLKFVTGCSRPPLLGFRDMHPALCIQCTGQSDRLPTASTCMNLLKMPAFADEKTLRDKLLLAIESTEGFELS